MEQMTLIYHIYIFYVIEEMEKKINKKDPNSFATMIKRTLRTFMLFFINKTSVQKHQNGRKLSRHLQLQ